MIPLILASGSPRRRELLEQVGLTFLIDKSQAAETLTGQKPEEEVCHLAMEKAKDVAGRQKEECIVIGADTVVSLNGSILGKPKDKDEAGHMIRLIQNHTHQVYTGVCLIHVKEGLQEVVSFYECTQVSVRKMDYQEIENYIQTDEPYDKAGGYGIQGLFARYVTGIEGDYNNVVGLPICSLLSHLKHMGYPI